MAHSVQGFKYLPELPAFDRPTLLVLCAVCRALTQMKGYDAAAHVLACFGGAGGQHACAIATALGMKTIFVHRWVAA